MRNTLDKSQRLKGRKIVGDIFDGQKLSVASYPFRAFYTVSFEDDVNAKFGIGVPKKKFKRAVDRNHIKRLVKESLRLNKTILYAAMYNKNCGVNTMIICNAESIPSFELVETKIKELLNRLAKTIDNYEKK